MTTGISTIQMQAGWEWDGTGYMHATYTDRKGGIEAERKLESDENIWEHDKGNREQNKI